MDYKSLFKEKLSKLLFLEIDWQKFKKCIDAPENIEIKSDDLYLPISSKYVASTVNNNISINNLPIYYFVEGMLIALGADDNFRYLDDYIIVFNNIKQSEVCGKNLVADRIKEENYEDAYLLLKGLFKVTYNEEYFEKLLLVGNAIRERDSAFSDILLSDIEFGINEFEDMKEPYLYKALYLKSKDDYLGSRAALNEYYNRGGEKTEEIAQIAEDIENIATYEKAIEYLDTKPDKTIKMLLPLLDKFSKNPLIYYYIAVAYRKLQNYEKALCYLEDSIEIESGILEVVNEFGINYACLGDYKKAIEYFRKAFEVSKDVEICTNLVMCYLNIGDEEEAKLHYELAKKLNPEDEIVKDLERMFIK